MHNPYAAPARTARSLSFAHYSLVASLLSGFLGLLFGLAGLIGSLVGMHVFFQFGSWGINGFAAGAAGMFMMPALFTVGGMLLSLITYHPVNWVVQRL